MPFEHNTSPEISVGPEVEACLSEFAELSLEITGCKELLPGLQAKETFIATSFIENVCGINPEAAKILNPSVES